MIETRSIPMKNRVIEVTIPLEFNESESKLFDELSEVAGEELLLDLIAWLIREGGVQEGGMSDVIREAFEMSAEYDA